MTAKGIEPEFAERVFEQIRGFGEYGFPESHAASFALIAYATAWLKRHHPDVFACSLLNAQPMGFYTAATIVEDAKRHGVEVLPVDIRHSRWDCTLEEDEGTDLRSVPSTSSRKRGRKRGQTSGLSPFSPFPLRMGLRYVKGLGKAHRERIERAAGDRPFSSVEEFVDRTELDEGAVTRLAEAGALDGFHRNRRAALWAAKGAVRTPRSPLSLKHNDPAPLFPDLDPLETIGWDYEASRHSARGHPLAPLRERLRTMRLPDAKSVTAMRNGRRVRYAGNVICRQRPGTASGVVFLTMEDETGFVNVVIWSRVYEEYKLLIKASQFLGVTGKLQVEDGVTHLIAAKFWMPKLGNRPAHGGSRDFH
jgi:error-prone DNA polymerase